MSELNDDDFQAESASREEPSRRGPRLLLPLFFCLLLGGLAAGGWALWGPGDEFDRSDLEDGGLRTQRFRLQLRGSDRQSPEIYLAPEIVGSGLSGRSDGTWRLNWMGLEGAYEHRIWLGDDDSLMLEDRRETIVVKQGEILLLTAGGPYVLAGQAAEDLLPVIANPRLYVGAELVNSIPKGAIATDELGKVAGLEVLVKHVYPGSPAEAGGLEAGDVLLSVDMSGHQHQVRSRQTLATWWADITAGNTLVFQVRRGAKTLSVSVKTRNRSAQEFRSPSSVSDDRSYFKRH